LVGPVAARPDAALARDGPAATTTASA